METGRNSNCSHHVSTKIISNKMSFITIKKETIKGSILFLSIILISFFSGKQFLQMHKKDIIIQGPGISSKVKLSVYFPLLKGTPGDTDVYVFKGKEEGGNLLILGGTHPNEPAGFLTAIILIENIHVDKGKVFIIPQANHSGFTHNDPHEGNPQRFPIQTPEGIRWFRYGSRLTNPVHQWPDPVLYVNPSGQKLSGAESRNLNRCYPGKAKGNLTERIAFGITNLIKKEQIDLAIDLHEAAPEYPVINAIVFHENSAELAALVYMELQMEGFEFRLEASPKNLRGLSHREWGDTTKVKAILLESANASHGRLKGKPSVALIIDGKDKNYVKASRIGRLFVPFDEKGIPLKVRVGRHVAAIKAFLSNLQEVELGKGIDITNFPSAREIIEHGTGIYLEPPK